MCKEVGYEGDDAGEGKTVNKKLWSIFREQN